MKKLILLTATIIYNSLFVFSQYYENGQDPFSINWKKIETPHFEVIFSEDATNIGKLYAAYLEKIYITGGLSLDHSPIKVPVIIHNQNSISNGEVAWAPRRMNLYAVPSQNGNAESYAKQLALHEFRHVVQIDKLNQSWTRALYFVFGEQIIGGLLGWHVPRWFLEGDAVAYETGASNAGRGRQPDFLMELRAQVDQEGIYSYPKAQFGSYKDYVPDHYKLGYELIARTNQKYGDSVWINTLNQVAKSPIHPNAFSKGIKKSIGLPERKLYAELMNDFKSESIVKVNSKDEGFINFLSPYELNGAVYTYRTGYDDISRLIKLDAKSNKEKVISRGSIFNQTFSMNDSTLVWNELKRTRWENDNYTRIVKYDLSSNKKLYLTKKTRVYHSRISPDNKQILSVEVNKDLSWYISFRDAENGELLRKIEFGMIQPIQPTWSPNMKEIALLTLGNNGKSLGILNLATEKIQWIIKDQYIEINNPYHTGNNILLSGTFNGTSNLLQYNIAEKQWKAITKVPYGVQEGRVYGDSILFSSYSANGYKLTKRKIEDIVISQPTSLATAQSKYLIEQEEWVDLNSVDTTLLVKNYSRFMNVLNFHSWAPLSFNIQNIDVNPGVMALSQNPLSTSTLVGGYEYLLQENTHKYYADYSYKGFYPIINVGFSKSYFNQNLKHEDDYYLTKWKETSLNTSVTLPFVFDRGAWQRRLQTTVYYDYTDRTFNESNQIKYQPLSAHNFYYLAYFSNLRQMSYRDLQSRWGQTLQLTYMHSPFDMDQYGSLASGELQLLFPGFASNHGIKLYTAYQKKQQADFSYSDQINYPHGYFKQDNTEMESYQFSYKLPLLYPDLNAWEYLYIMRLKANMFYQTAYFSFENKRTNLNSLGFDLTTDLHAFRFVFPFELGIRYARRMSYEDNYYEFLFNMSF